MMNQIRQAWEQAVQSWPLTRRWGKTWGARALALSVILGLMLVVAAFIDWETLPTTYNHAKVRRGPFRVTLVESGDVESVNQQTVTAPMMWGSKLQIIDLVEEGTQVKQGDFLIQFDAADLVTNLDLAKDNLETLKADLEKLKAQQSSAIAAQEGQLQLSAYSYDQAKLSLESQQFESEVVKEESRIALKQAELDLATARKQLDNQKIIHQSQRIQSQTRIRQAETRIQNIQERIDMMRLTAPIDGMVVYHNFNNERIKKGYESRPGRPLVSIPDLGHMQIKLFINEVDRLKVARGLKATVTLDAYPDRVFQGHVSDVARLAQTVRNDEDLKGFAVYVAVEGVDDRLKPGMTAKVEIVLDELDEALFIPLAAVHEVAGQTVVYPKGKTSTVEVVLGPRNDGFVVVEEGLKEGQQLEWLDPIGKATFYGASEEQRRINELRSRLRQSFSVFEQRGILYDYIEGAAEPETGSQSEGGQPAVDLSKLPASIRERLQQQGTAKPAVVRSADPGKVKSGTFRVSPEMMNRLNRPSASDTAKKAPTPSHGE